MKFDFKLVEGRIILVTSLQVWGDAIINEYDVTDKVLEITDEYAEHSYQEAMKTVSDFGL